jgi:hypothetical protein
LVTKKEAVTPPALVEKLLRATPADVVLVGGQALAFWVHRFNLVLPPHVSSISADTDFLARSAADKATVQHFSRILNGSTLFPNERALTALVGQAYFDISDDEFINVDVIHKVVGIAASKIRQRAVRASAGQGDGEFLVMHPLDVLHSRLMNLYKLVDKQNPKGRMQLQMAIDVGREFLRTEAAGLSPDDIAQRSPLQGYVSAIAKMAGDDAGRKVATRFGAHVADAIDPALIPTGPFWTRRWPTLKLLMSPAYAAQFAPPAG